MATKPVIKSAGNSVRKPVANKTGTTPKKPITKTPVKTTASKAATKSIDLSKLFGTVAQTMAQNKTSLNEADTYNHDHGDNMVQIFEVITQAMKEKQDATPAQQLAYASKILEAKSQSGSAKIYAEGLSNAAAEFKGSKAITTDTAMLLIQTLLGAQGSVSTTTQTQSGGTGDLLGSLLGSLSGTQQSTTQSQESGTGDLLGSLLGGLTGTSTTEGQSSGQSQIDIGTLLNAGMAFAQSKQAGGSTMDAILNAVVSSSKMSDSSHRSQSGALVANTLLQAVGQLAAKKK